MEDQIQRWAAQFGLPPEQVQTGLNAIAQFIKAKVPAPLWQQLEARLPALAVRAGEALTMSQPAVVAAGGSDSVQLVSELGKAGFTADRALRFVPEVLGQVKAAVGPELARKLQDALPGLAAAAGGGLATVSATLDRFLKK